MMARWRCAENIHNKLTYFLIHLHIHTLYEVSSCKIKVDRIDATDETMEIVHKLGTCQKNTQENTF